MFCLQLPATVTRMLLTHFKWDRERLMERYEHASCCGIASFLPVAVLSLGRRAQAPQFCSSPLSSFVATHGFFCKDNTNILFLSLPNFRKVGIICSFYWMPQNQKCFSFRGPPDLIPGPCWGLHPQTLVIGSRYRARHGAMPPDIDG